ncbi:WhiB family transcriptional regulator [Streptomyces sp. ISL-94]|nr:WhiB family transcriptional regulator [Streptomyces sp. ISL-94]MBT2477596.1 WhiB family transcriptional regulator [Streptomyces sp. ISL-94]
MTSPSRQWMDAALCAQTDPDLFFPEKGGSYQTANKVCASCPVRRQCADYAQIAERGLSYPYRHGAWGGTSPRKRAGTADETARQARDADIRRYAAAGWDAEAIATAVNCTSRTVWRVLAAKPRQFGEAA